VVSLSPFLSRFFPVPGFSPEEQQQIVSAFRPVGFDRGAFLLTEGQTENRYWIMEQGWARSFVTDPGGRDISIQFFSAGDVVIDWSSFFLRQPTRENIQALSDCQTWQLDFDTFQILFHQIPAFREQGRARLVGSFFAHKRHHISVLADPAKDRYVEFLQSRPDVLNHVPLKHIATYLGITDTSLSRIRKEISSDAFLS
jgi:CRP-like cAMP-binding protein